MTTAWSTGSSERSGSKFISLNSLSPCAIRKRLRSASARARDLTTRRSVARPIWRGSLSFGLVAIPVQLHTAVRENRPNSACCTRRTSRRSNERVCQRDGKPSPGRPRQRLRIPTGRYVVLTKEDFKAAALERIAASRSATSCRPSRSTIATSIIRIPAAGQRRRACLRDLPRRAREDEADRHRQGRDPRAPAPRRRREPRRPARAHADAVRRRDRRRPESRRRSDQGPGERTALAKNLIEALASDWDPDQDDYQRNLQDVIKRS